MGTVYRTQSQGYENTTYQAHSQGHEKLLPLVVQTLGEEVRLPPFTLQLPCTYPDPTLVDLSCKAALKVTA